MLRNSIKFTETNTGNGHVSRKSGGGSQPPSPPEPPKGPSGNGGGSRKPPSEEEKKILKDGLKPTGGAVLKYAEEHYPELVEKGKELLTEVEEAAAEAKDKVVEVIPEIVSEAKETVTNVVSESGKIVNDVLDCPRKGSALKIDIVRPITEANGNIVKEFPAIAQAHGFNDLVDNYAGHAIKTPINNGTLYQLDGFLNGVKGRFEWIIQNGKVTHRMFIKNGIVNGVAIKP